MTQKVTKFEAHVPYVLNGRNMQKSQNALVVVRQWHKKFPNLKLMSLIQLLYELKNNLTE